MGLDPWIFIIFFGIVIYLPINYYLRKRINQARRDNKHKVLNIFTHYHILKKLFYLIPAFFVYWILELVSLNSKKANIALHLIKEINQVIILLIIVWSINSMLDAFTKYSHYLSNLKNKPIKSYAQVIKLIVWSVFVILSIAILLHKSPWGFLTGLGALSALLMLIFRDTLLGFVSSILIATDDIVRVGDWITMPKFNINGDVIELGINTTKVKNFDNTHVSIPTSNLVTHDVQNWRAMYQYGGRCIQRHMNIDVNTIKFCSKTLLATLQQQNLLMQNNQDDNDETNSPFAKITNLTLFRNYITQYLHRSKDINQTMEHLVRELQSSGKRLPIEIYAFTISTHWTTYEEVQARLFDHIFAILPLFELRAYQDETDAGYHLSQ